MTELIVAVLGAGAGLIILRMFDKSSVDKNQKKLESEVVKIKEKVAGLEGEQKQEDAETQRKVDDIEKEKNTEQSSGSLVDFFGKRK